MLLDFTPMTVLETKRLRVRRLVPADLDILAEMLDDPDVTRYFGSKEAQLEATRNWMALYDAQGFGMCAVDLRATGELIGRVGFAIQEVEGEDLVEIGWMVGREHWGKGYATEAARALRDYAFAWHRLPKLISLIEPANAASIAVARKIGETYERETFKWDKTLHIYSVTREQARAG